MAKVLFISLDSLVEYPSKDIRNSIKQKHVSQILSSFTYSKQSGEFLLNLQNSLHEHINNHLNNSDFIDVSMYKLYESSISVLKTLKAAGFLIIVTSDSSHSVKPIKLLSSLGINEHMWKLVTYTDIKLKKNNENYVKALIESLFQDQKNEYFVVSSKVDKEILSAYHHKIKHIWLNTSLENIVI